MIEAEIQRSYKFTKSPSYLVLIVILINLIFGLAYIAILLIEETFDAFGSGTFANLGYDTIVLVSMIILQQIIYFILIWQRYTESYTVSKEEIKHKKGIFKKIEQEYSLKNMTSTEINKSFWGNLLNYGDISISYSIGPKMTIRSVSNPEYLISLIKE